MLKHCHFTVRGVLVIITLTIFNAINMYAISAYTKGDVYLFIVVLILYGKVGQ